MKRLVIVGRVRSDAHAQALEVIRRGPPFDPAARAFDRHNVYLSTGEVIFVFEAVAEVEWRVDDLISDFGAHAVHDAFEAWRVARGRAETCAGGVRLGASGSIDRRTTNSTLPCRLLGESEYPDSASAPRCIRSTP